MEKPKSKGDLRAAGKKRLEEFRQKKQQKGSSNKSSSTAIKALADDDKSLSGALVALDSFVPEQVHELLEKSDGRGTNRVQDESVTDGSPVTGFRKPEKQLLIADEPVPGPSGEPETVNSELVTKSIYSDQSNSEESGNNGGATSHCTSDSKIFPGLLGSGQLRHEGFTNVGITEESRLDKALSKSFDIQSEQTFHDDGAKEPALMNKTLVALQETTEHSSITEMKVLNMQVQNLVEQKELVFNQLAVKAEQQVQDASKIKSLTADLESIREELNSAKNDKVQLIEEFTSSQKELQNSNRHLASELVASQEQVVVAKERASLLSEDLERAKQEVVEANAKFAKEMEIMENVVRGGELRIAQMVEEMSATQMLFQGLQDEKLSLNDDIRRLENELHKCKEELLLKGNELDLSNHRMQALEENLASEHNTLQQLQELLAKKSQLVEGARLSNEKLEGLLSAKEEELGAYGDQIRLIECEKLGLTHEMRELKLHLDVARQKEEGVLADLEAQCKAKEEQLKQLQDEKLELQNEKSELLDELQKAKLSSGSLRDERSGMMAAFDLQLKQLREDLRKSEEENIKQGNQLLESSEELHKVRGDHAQAVKEIEFVRECRTDLDRESAKMSEEIQKLTLARDQLLLLIEEQGQGVVNLGNQLEEHKDQLRRKFEENSSLMVLLQECRGELEKTSKYASQCESELEKHQAVSDELLEEKGRLAAELVEIRVQCEVMQETANQQGSELEKVTIILRSLEEDHGKLLSQSRMSTEELAKSREDKEALECELVAYRERVTTLEEQYSGMVNLLEDTRNELQRVREDNLLSSSHLVSELEKYKVLYSEVVLDKERVVSELQLAIEQLQLFQQEMAQGKERISELTRETEESHLKLDAYKEQLTRLEDVNRDLVGVSDRQREQLGAALSEKEKLMADHVVELHKSKEQQSDAEETKTKQTSYLQQLLADLEDLRNEKAEVASELETYKQHYRELGDENWKVASEFNECKDQLRILMDAKTLAESTLEESQEMERKLKEGNALLMTELQDQRVRYQSILSQNADEVERLEQQVKGLVEQMMARELAVPEEHSQVMEGLSKRSNRLSEERDVLQSDVEASKRQLEELTGEKHQLNLKFEDASEAWKVEKFRLSRDLEISLENQNLLRADKAQLESEVAELMLQTQHLDAQHVKVAMELNEQRARLVGEVEGKEQLLQTLAEGKSQFDSELRIERERAILVNDHLTQMTKDLRTTKLRIQELELETAQSRDVVKDVQTQVELLTAEKSQLAEENMKHLSNGDRSQQLHEEIQAIRQLIGSKDEQVEQLTTKCKLLQTELEVSNMEKRDLAQDLASLKHQLQQISDQKLPGVHELAHSAANKQHMLGNEELKTESTLSAENVAKDLPILGDEERDTGDDSQEPAHEVQSLHKLEEISKNLGQELRETLSLVGYVRLEFENQTEQLKKVIEEMKGKQHLLDISCVQVDELDRQVKELTANAAKLQSDKDTALEALHAAQEELRLSKSSLIQEKGLLEDNLLALEGTAAALQAERDDMAGKFADLERSHTHLSERSLQESKDKLSLQEQVATLHVRVTEYNTELGSHKEQLAQSNFLVQSLVQELEDLICNAFPEAGQEVVSVKSSKCNKDIADYQNCLVSRLHVEITGIRHLLQDAHARLSETSKQLQEAEEQSMRLLKERTRAVETADQTQSELMKAVEEKETLEISLKKLEAFVSAENLRANEEAMTSAKQASEVEGLLLQIESLNNQLESANAEKEILQTGLAQAEQKLSATREKLSLAVSKGKAVVQQRDAWKLSFAEKSKELEMMDASYQQELQDKDIAANNAERKIADLAASLDHMARLGIQLESSQKMISTMEKVFSENEDLFRSLDALLDDSILPKDWRSSELVEKILWITGCVRKLVRELATTREEMQSLMEHAAALMTTAESFEARVTAMALELDSVKLEKEELVLRVEGGADQLQVERDQMTEMKAQLTGIIRQLDLDVAVEKREKGDLATRLQAQAEEIVELNTAVINLSGHLSDCYEAISPVELDPTSVKSSLDWCKYVLKVLMDNHNSTVGKLKVILGSFLSHPFQEAIKGGLFQGFDDNASSKEISGTLTEKIGEALASLEKQAVILVAEQIERNRLQLELTQKDKTLNAEREKLSAAVSKGKLLVQQRDSLKQAMIDKDAELETLENAHKEELRSKELLLQEVSVRLTASLEHAADLEKDFVSFKTSAASNLDTSLADRLSEMERQLSETQQWVSAAESEAENSRNSAAVLLSDLELSRSRLDNLVEEVKSLTKDKNELAQHLESASNKYKFELQEFIVEKTQLISQINNSQADLAVAKEAKEKLVHEYTEVSNKCGKLRSQIEELLIARAKLVGENETLQLRIAELEMALNSEAQARMKVELHMEAVAARIRKSTGELVTERSIDGMTSIPHDSLSGGQLDSLCALLVVSYEAALREVDELAKEKAVLLESQQTMTEKASSEREVFETFQQRLAAKDVELSTVQQKLEEVDSRKEKEEEASKVSREELAALREELTKARIERDALHGELVQVEQRGATTREKLSLAIKKGKGVSQQRDLLKQSLSEQQSLVARCEDELRNKEFALKKIVDEHSICKEKVQALELAVSSLRTSVSTLEQELKDKDSLVKEIEVVVSKWNFPSQWQSKDIREKLEWLVAAVSNAENNLIRAGQERDALKKAAAQLSSELTDAQTRADQEMEARSLLGTKLQKCLGETESNRNRIAQLETLLAEAGGAGQQTEQLTGEVLELKRSLQQKQAEVDRAEEAVIAWVKRSEESEKYIRLCQDRISELEQTSQESVGSYQQIELLKDEVARLEEAVQQKEAAVKAMETSRGKAMNKLTLTTNKFRELYQQSEGLVVELERMHKHLQEKDAEIVELKEVAKTKSQFQMEHENLQSKRSLRLHLEKLFQPPALSGANPATSPLMAEQENSGQVGIEKSDEERCIAHVNVLLNQLSALTLQSQARQAELERKEVQLRGTQKELEEVVAERALLNANLQREQMQSERLKAEIASMQAAVAERVANQAEEIEEVQVGKRLSPISVPTPHVRGARRPNSIDVAIDVDSEMNQSPVEFDDKGHGFKSLASAQFMPRGTRIIGEQIDRLCVVGGRVLMRQPAARLTVTLYWLAIHIWMVFLISAAHI